MNKRKIIETLGTLMAVALRHRIGSIVNQNEIYSQKYAKDAESLLNEAKKISLEANWNSYDKKRIANETRKKLKAELESKSFLDEKKFDIMEREMNLALKALGLHSD